MTDTISLSPVARELLRALDEVPGFDIYSLSQAKAGRELELHGLARITRAKAAPEGWPQRPYFGIEIEPFGQDFVLSGLAGS